MQLLFRAARWGTRRNEKMYRRPTLRLQNSSEFSCDDSTQTVPKNSERSVYQRF